MSPPDVNILRSEHFINALFKGKSGKGNLPFPLNTFEFSEMT